VIAFLAFDSLDLHELTRSVWRGGDDLGLEASAFRAAHGLKTTHGSGGHL
jgi:hypothetical protein